MPWSHIILEAHCMFDIISKRKHAFYRHDRNLKGKGMQVNENFISPAERPKWCVKMNKGRIPQYRCMFYGKKKCPFFAFANAEKSDYRFLWKKYETHI